MTLFADSPDIASSPSAPTDASRRTPDRESGRRNQVSTQSGPSCLRCDGLLVLSYTASLESDLTGRPMRLWRCVNCGNCVDHDIMANRGKGSGSARPPARPPTSPPRARRPQNRTKHEENFTLDSARN